MANKKTRTRTKLLRIRVYDNELLLFKHYARDGGVTLSDLVRDALNLWLDHHRFDTPEELYDKMHYC